MSDDVKSETRERVLADREGAGDLARECERLRRERDEARGQRDALIEGALALLSQAQLNDSFCLDYVIAKSALDELRIAISKAKGQP